MINIPFRQFYINLNKTSLCLWYQDRDIPGTYHAANLVTNISNTSYVVESISNELQIPRFLTKHLTPTHPYLLHFSFLNPTFHCTAAATDVTTSAGERHVLERCHLRHHIRPPLVCRQLDVLRQDSDRRCARWVSWWLIMRSRKVPRPRGRAA